MAINKELPQIFPQFSNRFFYFTTLGEKPAGQSELFKEQGAALRQAAEGYLSAADIQYNKLKTLSNDASIMQNALNFLKNAASQEQANETKFFANLFKEYPDFLKTEIGKQLKSCFTKSGIDYPLFMATLREMSGGREDLEKIVNQTSQQYDVVNTEIRRISRHDENNQKNQNKNIKALLSQLWREEDFANKKQTSSSSLALELTRPFANAINGLRLSPDAYQVTQYVRNNFLSLLGVKKTIVQDPKINKGYILEMSLKASQIAADVLKEETGKDPTRHEIYTKALQILKDLNRDKNNLSGAQKKELEELRRHAKSILSSLDLLEEQTKALTGEGKYLKIGSRENIVGLTKPIRERLENLLASYVGENNKKLKELREMSQKSMNTKQAREEYLGLLQQILYKIDNNVNTQLNTIDDKKEFISRVNSFLGRHTSMTMYTETEFASARGINDIFKQIGLQIFSNITGGSRGKADVISLAKIRAEWPELPESTIQELFNIYETNYQERRRVILDKEREKATKQLDKIGQKVFGKLYNSEDAYSVTADEKANEFALNKLFAALKKQLKLSDKSYKEFLARLGSAFLVENSVKHSDYYLNDFGFHGGSLGSGLYEQITNINRMAELGGITTADRDWLIFAVMNCGQGLIGASLKPTLESYFSTFASLLMFRSGSELAKQVQQQANNLIKSSSGTATMRLYTFQSMYVPASYLLELTWQALEPAAAKIYQQASSTVANRAVISNSVSYTPFEKWPGGEEAFTTFAAENYGSVSISLQLLAGFMDVLNALQTAINNMP